MRKSSKAHDRHAPRAAAWLLLALLSGGFLPVGGARAGDPDVYTNLQECLRSQADPDVFARDHAALEAAAGELAVEIAAQSPDRDEAADLLAALRERAAGHGAAPIWQRLSELCHSMFRSLGL